ncbi:hypothetical protein GCM10010211_39560 [Streptomyces albospinus]|uniref:Uncharacterized protein n=1 Tax=Streptomyces albospinus TaxID=285515 RepID=A0ABQ2V856_9ACTN|nr:hypothetical protein GCM10010211_39560 [Streptomyces albospinus]
MCGPRGRGRGRGDGDGGEPEGTGIRSGTGFAYGTEVGLGDIRYEALRRGFSRRDGGGSLRPMASEQ